MRIWFRTHTVHQCSWTIVWNYLRKALKSVGADVYDNVMRPPEDVSSYVELWWGNPAEWSWGKRKPRARVGLALAEAESLPALHRHKAIENLQLCDLLICPSRFSMRAYEEAPLDMPMRVAFFGVDTQEMPFVERNWSRRSKLRFLLAGAAQFRKGTWLGIEGFLQAFTGRENVELTVWSSVKTPMRERLKTEYGDSPKIVFDDRVVASPFEVYKEHDILVSPHLSEGFGLQIGEAMSTGMPCIVARCSSPRETFRPDCGWFTEMSEYYGPVCLCLDDTNGLWRIPDLHGVAESMAYVHSHREECATKSVSASRYVREHLTWEHTAVDIIAAVQEELELYDEEDLSGSPSLQRGDTVARLSSEPAAAC